MKAYILIAVTLIAACQTSKKTTTPTTTSTTPEPVKDTLVNTLSSLEDSASYAIGVSVANYYKQMGVMSLNTTLISNAINTILNGDSAILDDNTCNTLMNTYLKKLMEEKSKGAIEAGEKFLEENKKRPEIKVTASGLQYEIIKEGTGIKPTAVDTFVCHYKGTFLDGKQFDASYDRGQPLVLPVTSVIKGWTEGLQLMPVGSKYKFYIPYQLGYGPADYMSIPGGSVLIFEVELLDVKKKN